MIFMIDFAFIDSGTGGIPYLTYLKEKAPLAKCIYVGDTANFPYGEKTHEEIVTAVVELCKKIVQKFSPRVIIVACNTMSVNSLDVLREVFPEIQFVGTVPAIKVAGEISKKRRIGLLATSSTVKHPYNQDLKNHFASDCELVLRADPELISFIEHKSFVATPEERVAACKPAVEFFRKENCDVIILGCTHFLNVADEMQKVAGSEVRIVDSKEGVVNQALKIGGISGKAENKAELFITGLQDKSEYDVICKEYNLSFGGKL